MAVLLNIDTTTEIATVSISNDDLILETLDNNNQKEHASFLQPAIKEVLKKSGCSFKDISAISVTEGPGSYTGIRVGLASAKGFCYALSIPLITVSTLEVMALSAIKKLNIDDDSIFYCPMIDARRMEVFTCLYNKQLTEIIEPCAAILDQTFLKGQLENNKVVFFGTGSFKLMPLINSKHALFEIIQIFPEALAQLAYKKLQKKIFTDLINFNPLYIKQFYTL